MGSSAMTIQENELQIEHIIDIPKDIGHALHDLCCIYKVPPHLRNLNGGEAYEPQLISIGPFHHEKPLTKSSKFQSMHTQKQRYFISFWERVTNKKSVAKYKAFLKKNTNKIRHYYSVPIVDINDDDFVDMILLDSVFILELFLRNSETERKKDYMFTTSWICKGIQRDLLLLENQLPMFVLEALYGKIFKDNLPSRFVELGVNYFEDYIPYKSILSNHDKHAIIAICQSCKHFTDLIRCFYLPKKVHDKEWDPSIHFILNGENEYIPKTAVRLDQAGVNLEVVYHRDMLDIKFTKIPVMNWLLCFGCIPCFKCFQCRLQIPQFKVKQTTECVLRNLIALEKCHYSDQPFICSYVFLIDSLINSNLDVAFLVEKEIIVNELGSNHELAEMTNGLCKNVVVTHNYYGNISKKLQHHYYNSWKRSMGGLKSLYFRDAWRFSSTVVGVVVFIFAILNFLRLIGVYKPKHN
ncbi:UPF0481 protein At3g47200-like [Lotus japonicus]|uniref:UPF0481 protein At3g47200-like n=1 Tax=Lotus japonicus TaxID=34305 RepID=UPI0025910139|nr:UPF0481 protein At3g47200-like [Lotus japonicus]